MCDDHAGSHQEPHASQLSRRSFLTASGAVAAGAMTPVLALSPAEAAPGLDGTKPFPMAMHVHSSFSEGWASMSQHLDQATKNGVKVLWFTDHDFRMSGLNFKQVVHFRSRPQEAGQGGRWEWTRRTVGSLTADSAGQVVQSPSSPSDTVAGGSLSLSARSSSTALATLGFFADAHPAG